MWAQNWEPIIDIVLGTKRGNDMTDVLIKLKYTTLDLVKQAEDYYSSLGLPKMTDKFWKYSYIEKEKGANISCHGSAANMFSPGDFRYLIRNKLKVISMSFGEKLIRNKIIFSECYSAQK